MRLLDTIIVLQLPVAVLISLSYITAVPFKLTHTE